MSMAQDDCVQLLENSFLWNAVVVFDLTGALKEAAVYEDVGFTGLDQIRRPRDFASAGAMNGDLHLRLSTLLLALWVARGCSTSHGLSTFDLSGPCRLIGGETHAWPRRRILLRAHRRYGSRAEDESQRQGANHEASMQRITECHIYDPRVGRIRHPGKLQRGAKGAIE